MDEPVAPSTEADDGEPVPSPPPDGWPASVRWPEGLAADDVRVRGGPSVGWNVTGVHPNASSVSAWRAALAASGFDTEACGTSLPMDCAVTNDEGGRVRFRAGRSDHPSWVVFFDLLPTGHEPLDDFAEPCVTPPERAHRIHVSSAGIDTFGDRRHGSSNRTYETHVGVDVDGDARGDTFVPVPDVDEHTCPWDLGWEIYVMRGECGHLVGRIDGRPIDETDVAPFVGGVRRIETVAHWGTSEGVGPEPTQRTRVRTYAMRDGTLHAVGDEQNQAPCAHCSITSCRVLRP